LEKRFVQNHLNVVCWSSFFKDFFKKLRRLLFMRAMLVEEGWLRLIVFSDTHCKNDQLPSREESLAIDADALIHCGDFMDRGSGDEALPFVEWLRTQPQPIKLVVPGNHDRAMDPTERAHDANAIAMLRQASTLEPPICSMAELDEACARRPDVSPSVAQNQLLARVHRVGALRIFCSSLLPRQPKARPRMAFGRARGPALRAAWLSALKAALKRCNADDDDDDDDDVSDERALAQQFDVLVTHTPPHAITDPHRIGDEQLRALLLGRKTSAALHLCGHVHVARGIAVTRRTIVVNCAQAPLAHREVDARLRGAIVVDLHVTSVLNRR
jgi:Icc-related predicted phosphoesterase